MKNSHNYDIKSQLSPKIKLLSPQIYEVKSQLRDIKYIVIYGHNCNILCDYDTWKHNCEKQSRLYYHN